MHCLSTYCLNLAQPKWALYRGEYVGGIRVWMSHSAKGRIFTCHIMGKTDEAVPCKGHSPLNLFSSHAPCFYPINMIP